MDPWLLSLPASVDVTLFFATRPDDAAGREIESLTPRLKRAHRLKGRPIDLPRLHNSLASVHGAGTLTDNIRRAKAIGDRLWHRSFSVCFDWTGSFERKSGRFPFVLRTGEPGPLSDFRAALRTEMLRDGFAVDRSFTPHITMLWADRRVDEAYPVAPIAWTVRDFVLTASIQGYSRHIEVARWPLKESA
jgi:2'-5' RNA ligase